MSYCPSSNHLHCHAPIVVRDAQSRRALEAELFSPERDYPIVVVAARDRQPVIELRKLAETTRSELGSYYVPGIHVLRKLNGVLGKALAVWPESVRIFWPELKPGSDPNGHPCIPVLHNEPEAAALEAFGYAFDLSRPRVRRALQLQLDTYALATRLLELETENSRHRPRRHRRGEARNDG